MAASRPAPITDPELVWFLQWCLPRLGLRWRGFRKVRRMLRERIERRLSELALPDLATYRLHLAAHADEWAVLDTLCRIPVSRFYRDRAVFEFLEQVVLPELSAAVLEGGQSELRCWSVGCASGEEPYTLAILWRLRIAPCFPGLRLRIVATDADPEAIARATAACYPPHVLRDLPPELTAQAFTPSPAGLRLAEAYRRDVELRVQDVRLAAPKGRFHMILCRNLVGTYFDDAAQRGALARLVDKLEPGGALVLGATETVPPELHGLVPWSARLRVHRAAGRAETGDRSDHPRDAARACAA